MELQKPLLFHNNLAVDNCERSVEFSITHGNSAQTEKQTSVSIPCESGDCAIAITDIWNGSLKPLAVDVVVTATE